MKKRVIGRLIAGCMIVAVLGALGASPASAAPSHILDPQLSLTGDCTTSSEDPIEDPSCPYPPGPSERFTRVTGIATDPYGNVYVADEGKEGENNAHIDIFDNEGFFVVELPITNLPESNWEPRTIAVDSEGYLYVYVYSTKAVGLKKLLRYDPKLSAYTPANGEIEYELTPSILAENNSNYAALAINPANNHLFAYYGPPAGQVIEEFGAGKDDNPVEDSEVGPGGVEFDNFDGPGLAIDKVHGRIYVTGLKGSTVVIHVLELAPPHNLIETINGSSTPAGGFLTDFLSLAVDESTGHLYTYEQKASKSIYELTEDGQYLSTLQKDLGSKEFKQQIVVDNGPSSPNGALNLEGRFIWVTATPPGVGHAFAFKPTHVQAPGIESVSFSDVSEDEALLQATVNPNQAPTTYSFEYVSGQQFQQSGFAGAQLAGHGTIAAGSLPVTVSAEATGLSPGSSYVFRIVAVNEVGQAIGEEAFMTYPAIVKVPCSNDEVRTGPSSVLPDCRAYELVTPADTTGRSPMGLGYSGARFPTLPASPDGNSVSFRIEGGLIPGFEGTGSLAGDPYLATRSAGGWSTVETGGKGTETTAVIPGAHSPDQHYSVWTASGQGPAVISGNDTVYVRYPDGHFQLLGRGSLGVDPKAIPQLISENAEHMIFLSSVHLEENAPPTGALGVYDRTTDPVTHEEVTHVASLLPGDAPMSALDQLTYKGSSFDGRGLAFEVSSGGVSSLYLRYNNDETYKVGEHLTFEGVAEGGKRLFYLKAGSLYAFDLDRGTIPFVTSSNVTVVNVSADGSTAYFASPSKLTSVPNPLGAKAMLGENNLYRSREGAISFVGTVSAADVTGEQLGKNVPANGLGLWVSAVGGTSSGNAGGFASDPSRTTQNGNVLLFQSNSNLTTYDAEGHRQVYRYAFDGNELNCLSCNPTGAPATGDANLQDVGQGFEALEPNTSFDLVKNLSQNGRRAFFQSSDPLVAGDTDGVQDVYEWEAEGAGICIHQGGCLYLISSGHSPKPNYLYAASADGDDVFFSTQDLLRPIDGDATPSIYDARVGGGFPEAVSAECEGEGCRPKLSPAPAMPTPGIAPGKSGNVPVRCGKGKRKVKRHGKVRCIKKKGHRRHHHRRRASNDRGVGK